MMKTRFKRPNTIPHAHFHCPFRSITFLSEVATGEAYPFIHSSELSASLARLGGRRFVCMTLKLWTHNLQSLSSTLLLYFHQQHRSATSASIGGIRENFFWLNGITPLDIKDIASILRAHRSGIFFLTPRSYSIPHFRGIFEKRTLLSSPLRDSTRLAVRIVCHRRQPWTNSQDFSPFWRSQPPRHSASEPHDLLYVQRKVQTSTYSPPNSSAPRNSSHQPRHPPSREKNPQTHSQLEILNQPLSPHPFEKQNPSVSPAPSSSP